MEFAGDAFISYAHLDNVELVERCKGWIANFHRALEVDGFSIEVLRPFITQLKAGTSV